MKSQVICNTIIQSPMNERSQDDWSADTEEEILIIITALHSKVTVQPSKQKLFLLIRICICFLSLSPSVHLQITLLINNAGVVSGRALLDTPDHLIERSFNVNVLAHFWVRNLNHTHVDVSRIFIFFWPRNGIWIMAVNTLWTRWFGTFLSMNEIKRERKKNEHHLCAITSYMYSFLENKHYCANFAKRISIAQSKVGNEFILHDFA